ncbi:MAG: hypothetical protein V3U72_05205 [Candidatus Aenigmarchaeota archaeon]
MIRVGVTTGLYYIARAEELATSLKKIGYALTRGTDAIEISGDTPHEIDYTIGKEIRHLAEKQGLDLCFHGSLTVPMGIPERSDWRDGQDHIEKSIRSAVFSGCKYVLFHACLHFWLEMITYTSQKLEIIMCDYLGRFVSEVLKENEKLREWWIYKMWYYDRPYPQQIVEEEELLKANGRAATEIRIWEDQEYQKRLKEEAEKSPPKTEKEVKRLQNKVREQVSKEGGVLNSIKTKKYIEEFARQKMMEKSYSKRRWRVDSYGKLTDSYEIMAHYMFYNKDPIWIAMAEVYKDVLAPYKMDYSDDRWVDKAWIKAQERNDREFKRFYYAAVAAKFLEGHMKEALNFINGKLIKELKRYPDSDKLIENAKNLKITIEMPDARDPKYAGLYLLWDPKQIYAAIKTIRKTLKTDRIFMTVDWEHIAGQGLDPLIETENLEKIAPDFGKYVISVHSNTPNPLHAHYPIELGDIEIYRLNYFLRKTGFGKQGRDVYLWFERGGGDDPFRQAVDALKLCAKFLEKDVHPDELPNEYFGIKHTGMDFWRQEQIMRDHRFEPLKDLLEVPEEEWGLLSTAATKKGKTKEFKKEEMK